MSRSHIINSHGRSYGGTPAEMIGGTEFLVIVRVLDCDRQPCVLTVGVFREGPAETLRNEIAEKLRDLGRMRSTAG